MRRVVAVVLALAAAGCGSSGAATVGAGCGQGAPPPHSLLILAAGGRVPAVCSVVRQATDVVVSSNDPRVARALVAADPGIRVWQERELQFGRPCGGCPSSPLSLGWIARNHPEWVLRDRAGDEVSGTLSGDPADMSTSLVDVGNVEYEGAWATALTTSLAKAPWAGVLVRLTNDPQLSEQPVAPGGGVLTATRQAGDLAAALSVIRGELKTNGYSLVADVSPLEPPRPGQIGSTDAVVVPADAGWPSIFPFLRVALAREVGIWLTDDLRHASEARRVFGYAAYLLAAERDFSAYAPAAPRDPLYRVRLGAPLDPPTMRGALWQRRFEQGVVAVNTGEEPVSVAVAGHGSLRLDPLHAVIATPHRLYR